MRTVESQHDNIGGVDSIGDLILNAGFEIVGRIFQTGGVDQEKTIVDASHDIIARSALFAGDDGDVFMREAIEKAGFTSVGLADKGDDR